MSEQAQEQQEQEQPEAIMLSMEEAAHLIEELTAEVNQGNANRRIMAVKMRGMQATIEQLNAGLATATEALKTKDAEIEQLKKRKRA